MNLVEYLLTDCTNFICIYLHIFDVYSLYKLDNTLYLNYVTPNIEPFLPTRTQEF